MARVSKVVANLCLLGAVVVVAALYAPEHAARLAPFAAEPLRKLRAAIPQNVATFVKLPEEPGAKPQATDQGRPAAQPRPPVSVLVARVARKPMPVRIETIGTVQPAAAVTIRPRVDSQIETVLVSDGASVKAGDVLVKLDSRQIEAQIRQAEGVLAKDRATLEQASRDVARYSELVSRQAGTPLNLDNAKTAVLSARAAIAADEAALENLKVQRSYYTIVAPISGRVGMVTLKAGNLARQGEASSSLMTIMQMSPIYVAFSMPQSVLPDLREALARGEGSAQATPQGASRGATGKVAVIDNAVDAATGTIMVRALFDNADEWLWPGQLCNLRVTLRTEPRAVVIPRVAIQSGQVGQYVFVIENKVAKLRNVTIERVQDNEAIIASGLEGDETVVVDGASQLLNNSRVEIRAPVASSGGPAGGGA